tara:strand:- start:486 stop:1307 length:822 start_codon:yes stop_codon:yes gene_type:complete
MQKHSTHKNSLGFTLIEMLIVIAIIGILASVAIPQYNQYKIRGYDAQTKQALKNMHMLCNAYWLDTSTLRGCDLSKIKEPTYGFTQNADVVATLPPSPQDNFCASAKHNDSPNKFSIDSAALISNNEDCGVALAAELAEKAEAERIAEEETVKLRKKCTNAIARSGFTEIQCRLTWGYKATESYEVEAARSFRGNFIDYNKGQALQGCRCIDGFRIPRLNGILPVDEKCRKRGDRIFCVSGGARGLKAVARPCEDNLPTVEECMAGEGLDRLS